MIQRVPGIARRPAAGFVPLAFAALSGSGMAATQSLYGFFVAPAERLGADPKDVGAVVALGAAAGRTMSPVAAVGSDGGQADGNQLVSGWPAGWPGRCWSACGRDPACGWVVSFDDGEVSRPPSSVNPGVGLIAIFRVRPGKNRLHPLTTAVYS